MTKKRLDFIVVVFLLVSGAVAAYFFELKALYVGLAYLLPASFYLFIRKRKNYVKIFWGTLIFGLFFGFFFDFIETLSRAWFVPELVIPYRVLGVVPVDDIVGFILMTLFTLLFYEHFLDDERHKALSKSIREALVVGVGLSFFVVIVFLFKPALIELSHAYFIGGMAAIVFPLLFLWRHPKSAGKFALLSIFFFFVWLLIELVAVTNGNWLYPGQYVGSVSVFGIAFPIEELFFWALCYAATITAFYEKFVDDGN